MVIPSEYEGKPVTEIEGWAFEDCTVFISVTIPVSITSIGSYSFKKCTSLTGIIIPDGVTSIGSYAFTGSSLTSIYYAGTEAEWNTIEIVKDEVFLGFATKYFYSKTAPMGNGNFWHYVNGVAIP